MGKGFIARILQRARLRRWRRLADRAAVIGLGELRQQRADVRQIRHELDRMLATADERLALPLIGSNAIRRPANCDWAWRPALWRTPIVPSGIAGAKGEEVIDAETGLYHDARTGEVALRQHRNLRPQDLAPFGLSLDVFGFDGQFLSLSVKLPREGLDGLRTTHVIRVETLIEVERPLTATVRLNVRHGPNTAELIAELPPGSGERHVEFDLAHAGISERRIEKAWLDVLFLAPAMNRIELRDLTVSRRPRAGL